MPNQALGVPALVCDAKGADEVLGEVADEEVDFEGEDAEGGGMVPERTIGANKAVHANPNAYRKCRISINIFFTRSNALQPVFPG